MLSNRHLNKISEINTLITNYENDHGDLIGLSPDHHRQCFIAQIIDSMRRIEYVLQIRDSNSLLQHHTDPNSAYFNPLKAI